MDECNKRGGELLYYKFKNFSPVFAEFNMKIKIKLKMKKTKEDVDFTWKPSWPNKEEKPRPSGISKFSYYVLGNQLQLHKTINNSRTTSLSLLLLLLFLFLTLHLKLSLLPETSLSLVITKHSKTLYKAIF